MFKLWCEWDCGQEDLLFTTEEKAKNWFNNNIYAIESYQAELSDMEIEPVFGETPFDYFDNAGLCGLIQQTVDPE